MTLRFSTRTLGAVAAIVAAGAAVSACSNAVKAPFDSGVCYYVVPADEEGGEPRFNRVAEAQPQIEFCAARLEEMRLRFLRLGGNNREITGSYQGQFIFIDRAGVSFGKTLTGARFFALTRSGDGRLVVPGAVERAPPLGPPAPVPAPPPG